MNYKLPPDGMPPLSDGRVDLSKVRRFETGATRDTEDNKLDFDGFFSPLVMERYAQYLHKHRIQPDGNVRDSDNWQKGIPLTVYMKSAWRHFFDWWKEHRGITTSRDGIEDAICGLLFNAMGYLHELLKKKEEANDHQRATYQMYLNMKTRR